MTLDGARWIVAVDGNTLPDPELIGGKAHSIARMRALGLNVPPAFVVTTAACRSCWEQGHMPAALAAELRAGIAWLERATQRTFGAGPQPLLVAVRSGAAISMPGMMDTVLNLGLNAATAAALREESGDLEFASDTHRRFLQMYATIVLKLALGELSPGVTPEGCREAIAGAGGTVPDDPYAQLATAVEAVFASWNSRRAQRYRRHHAIPDSLGTAVTVQAMVFGNLDDRSGTGVLFSRNPLTGAPAPFGEYLHRAQGEDVVSGRRTPEPLVALARLAPEAHDELLAAAALLERENHDIQDIEFTVQRGRLYLLQARAAKRAPAAAVRFAVDLVGEGLIDPDTALGRVTAEQVRLLLRPRLADGEAARGALLASGEPACEGVGVGLVVMSADEAEQRAARGEPVILARPTTSPEDVHGMLHSRAVVTEQGGATSHAAVVSRALGLPCVVGCGAGALAALHDRTVTVDGGSGRVYAGELRVVRPSEGDDARLATLAQWARARSPLEVRRAGDPEPAGILDLDQTPGGENPDALPALLAGHRAAKGGALASDAGVRAAIAAGVETIVAEHVLPPLLSAVQALHAAKRPAKNG